MRTVQARPFLALFTLVLQASACGGSITDPDPFPPGILAIELQPAASVKFKQVSYDLTRRDNFSLSGPVAVSLDGQEANFAFSVDDLQPSDYYLLTVRSDAEVVGEDRATTCRGRTSFAIETGKTTSVTLRMQCAGVTNTGSMVGSQVNECPVVTALRASPSRAAIAEPVALLAEVRDDMVGPHALTYSWSSNGGALSGPKAATTFECKQAGVVKINLLVSDGDNSCKENTASVTVTCTDEACIAANTCGTVNQPLAKSGGAGAQASATAGMGSLSAGRGAAGTGGTGGSTGGAGGTLMPATAGSRAVQNPLVPARGAAGRSGATMSPNPIQTQRPGVVGGTGASGTGGAGAGGRESHAAMGGSPGSTTVSLTVPSGGTGGAAAAAGAGGVAALSGGAGAAEGQAGAQAPPAERDDDTRDKDRPRGEGRRRRGGGAGQEQGAAGADDAGGGGAGGSGGSGGDGNTVVVLIVPAEVAGSGGAP